MAEKGQITTYMILGIVFVLIVMAVLLFKEPKTEQPSLLNEETQKVRMFVDSCIDTSAKQGILLIASRGGYIIPPEHFLKSEYADIPYYYYEGQVVFPSNESMNSQLEEYLGYAIKQCTDNFTSFSSQVEQGEIAVSSEITLDKINLDINYPLTVKTEKEQQAISKFKKSYDIRLERTRGIAEELMDEISKEPALIPYTLMIEKQEQNNVNIMAYEKSNDTAVYLIKDTNSTSLGDIPLIFTFAIKLNESEILPAFTEQGEEI